MASFQEEIGTVGETKERILELLLGGSKSAGEVAESLRIQKSAARVHLETLQSLRAVRSKFKIEKMGRPKKVYELTEKGREFFPRKYDLFLNLVLDKIAVKKGEREEKDSSFYIQSKNCILHKVASNNQDMICHGLHDKIISKSLEGNSDVRIELKECMALGNEYCRHIIRSGMQK